MPDSANNKLKLSPNSKKTRSAPSWNKPSNDYQLDDLATKRDIKELGLKVAKDIAESKAELVRWVVGVGVLQMTLIVGLMLKLTHSI